MFSLSLFLFLKKKNGFFLLLFGVCEGLVQSLGGGGGSWTEKSEQYCTAAWEEPKRRGTKKAAVFLVQVVASGSAPATGVPPRGSQAGEETVGGSAAAACIRLAAGHTVLAPSGLVSGDDYSISRTNCGFVCAREKFIHPVALVKID
jgi:hypothetical protein